MYPTSIISITFTDLIENPTLFKSILENLIKICDIEINISKTKPTPKPRRPRAKKTTKQQASEHEIQEENSGGGKNERNFKYT